jgi:hypothetical protein
MDFNKNNKQMNFNKIIGTISEITDDPFYCSVVLNVGTERVRPVQFCIQKPEFDKLLSTLKLGQKILIYFYSRSSRSKDGKKWHNYNNILGVEVV